MKGPTPEESLCRRKLMCIEKYRGNPFNLLHEHGNYYKTMELPTTVKEEYCRGKAFFDIKTRIGIKNGNRHLLSGSMCDMIVIFYNHCDTCALNTNISMWKRGVALFFVIDDMDEGWMKKRIVDYYVSAVDEREALDTCFYTAQMIDMPGVFIIPYTESFSMHIDANRHEWLH